MQSMLPVQLQTFTQLMSIPLETCMLWKYSTIVWRSSSLTSQQKSRA
jgi:hypothetical protein